MKAAGGTQLVAGSWRLQVVAGRWQLVAASGGCLPWPSRLSLLQQFRLIFTCSGHRFSLCLYVLLFLLSIFVTLLVCSFSLRFLSVSSCSLSSVPFFLVCLSTPWFVAFSGFYKAREWPLFERSCLKIMGHVRSCLWKESGLLATISWPPERALWRIMGSCIFLAKPIPGMR